MAAGIANKYYVRLDVGSHNDVFGTEEFLSYRLIETADGSLPQLVVEFIVYGTLADKITEELKEDTVLRFTEGVNSEDAKTSLWSAVNPMFKNAGEFIEVKVEALLLAPGYAQSNLTDIITGTSVDVISQLSQRYLSKEIDSLASPSDSMNWACGLLTPQEMMTKAQVRYWSSKNSPNTALTLGIPAHGKVIVRDIAQLLQSGDPKWDLYSEGQPTQGITGIPIMSNYTVYAHNGLQSAIGGVNRVAGSTVFNKEDGTAALNVEEVKMKSPFEGSRLNSFATYDQSITGRVDWLNMEDNANVHENWTLSKNCNLAQLTRCMDVTVAVTVPTNFQEVSLLDVALFKNRGSSGAMLKSFSGEYLVTKIDRAFNPSEQGVTTSLLLNRDGA